MDDSAIIYEEVTESYNEEVKATQNDEKTKTVLKIFHEKNVTCKTQNFYILVSFLLTTMVLLIAARIYCYLIKYPVKQNSCQEKFYINKCIIKLSNEIKDIYVKTTHTTFSMILSI